MRKELIISDFSQAVDEKELLSDKGLSDKWECLNYETAEISGKFLIACENSYPEKLTVSPKLSGWYEIYVCMTDMGEGYIKNHIKIKLSGEDFASNIRASKLNRFTGMTTTEYLEEALWKCADMTGQSIEISKPNIDIPYSANIFWLRFVPMSDEKVAQYQKRINDKSRKTMLAHMDCDFHVFDDAKEPHDFCKLIDDVKTADVGVICQEVTNDTVDFSVFDEPYAPRAYWTYKRMKFSRHLCENRDKIYPYQVEYAHKLGMEMIAGYRMQLSTFAFPFDQPLFEQPFVNENPQFRCKSRTGEVIDFLSYGYEQVQDYMVNLLLEYAKFGFDGVLMIFNRGNHLFFEEPVAKRFYEKYGKDVEFYRLPEADERIISVKCEIMLEFFKKARKAFDDFAKKNGTKPMKIYLNAHFTAQDSKIFGLDLELLAKNRCIDAFVQTKCRITEDIDDVLADDGLIDLEKYAEKSKYMPMYKREASSNTPLIVSAIPEMRRIADRYGIKMYSEIPWEYSGREPQEFVSSAKKIYAAGGMNLALWDLPPRIECPAEWCGTGILGDREYVENLPLDPNFYHRIIKVLGYKGQSLRYINPSWRG